MCVMHLVTKICGMLLQKHVEEVDKKNTLVNREGIHRGNPNMTVITESGLYSLIMSSKLPSAKEFKHWVTAEVLPSLRKTGYYDMAGQSNETFTAVDKLEKNAINGNDREKLNDLIAMYAKMSNMHTSGAWKTFEHCYNNAYHTALAVSKRAYEKKYNNGKSMSNPKYLEATGQLPKAIAVANQMIDERYNIAVKKEEDNLRYQKNIEMAKHIYATQFTSCVKNAADSMNYRIWAANQNHVICISFCDIPKKYREFITNQYPFAADLNGAYNYAYNIAEEMIYAQ